ncbi:MAG TPA: ATP synthase F1 subunit delta [Candidatus Entotheonella sp.]
MNGTGVARRYAKAMIDLATRDGTIAATGAQLQQHRDVFNANANLQSMLRNPGVLAETKTNLLTRVLDRTQPGLLVRNFILLLLKNDRLHHFDLICRHYDRMANEKLGRLTAHVTTAVELDAEQYQTIEQRVAAATQKEVQLDTQIDPSILGGVIVRIDNTVLDGSLRGRLTRLRRELVGG